MGTNALLTIGANRGFESYKRGQQLFIRTHDETLSVSWLTALAIYEGRGEKPGLSGRPPGIPTQVIGTASAREAVQADAGIAAMSVNEIWDRAVCRVSGRTRACTPP
jgi:hypothetical protein